MGWATKKKSLHLTEMETRLFSPTISPDQLSLHIGQLLLVRLEDVKIQPQRQDIVSTQSDSELLQCQA